MTNHKHDKPQITERPVAPAPHVKTITGQTAIDAEKDATIDRLTAELEAARKDNAALEEAYEETLGHCEAWAERADKAEADRDALVGAAFEAGWYKGRTASGADLEEDLASFSSQATAAYTAAIRAAEARGMREAAGICAKAKDKRNKQRQDYPETDREQRQRWMAGALQSQLLHDAILAAATAKENARE